MGGFRFRKSEHGTELPARMGVWCAAFFLLVVLLCPVFADAGNALSRSSADDLDAAMAEYLECYPLTLLSMDDQALSTASQDLCLAGIYHQKGLRPLWVTPDGPGKRAEIALEFLQNAHQEGLDPDEYQVRKMIEIWGSRDVNDLARLDTLITFNLIKYVHDVGRGHSHLRYIEPVLYAEAGDPGLDPLETIDTVLSVPDLAAYLLSLPPAHFHYRSLKNALRYYRGLERKGGWPRIPEGSTLRAGDRDDRVPIIMQRLAVTGDLVPSALPENEPVYGSALETAIKGFQKRHGLTPDGIVGPRTLAALNVPVHSAVRTIMINMARWRWQEHHLGEDYVLVNIAGFTLSGYRSNQQMIRFPVIVGKLQHQTPVFSDRIIYIDFHPYWNITPNIARNEELPSLRKNPFHLVERHVRLFSSWQADAVELDSTTIDWHQVSRAQISRYKLRQDPGPWNALGSVKFVFPNPYAVYMHDTPTQHLFSRSRRNFSHGCIRVSDPPGLAHFLLSMDDPSWTRDRIDAIFDSQKRKVVRLNEPIPVHITYQTVWVNEDGIVRFSRDIYKRDQKLGMALFPGDVIE